MVDLLGIGLTGLRTSRNNISVTGHNISNIDTPGYSRQRAVQVTNPAFGTGQGFFGSGARTQTIERIVDAYTIHQVRVDTSRLKDQEAYLKNASELDNLLSNENSALGNALNGFFEGMQSAANDPLSKPARQLVFSQIESVSQRFKTAQARLNDQNNNLNTQIRTYSNKINELTKGIQELNREILIYEGSRNHPPNDLFDKRDELIRQLSEIVDVNVAEQDGLNVNITIGNGIHLITGENRNVLETQPSANDKSRYEVYMRDDRGTRMHITNEITGGELGGVLRYRNSTLDPALNEMGRIALVFAGEMNNLHTRGTDLNGDQGVNLFRDINERNFQLDRIPGLQRDAPAGVWLDPAALNKLPAQEFALKIRDGKFVLHDAATGRDMTMTLPGAPFAASNALTADPLADPLAEAEIKALNDALQETYGFRLSDGNAGNPPNPPNLSASGVQDLINGGGLLISPVRLGASQLERAPELTDTNKIALAGIASAEGNAGTANLTYAPVPAVLIGAEISFDGTNFSALSKDGTPLTGVSFVPNAAPAEGGVLTITDAYGSGNDLVINVSNNGTYAPVPAVLIGAEISFDGTNFSATIAGAPVGAADINYVANTAPAEGGVLTIADGSGNYLVINVSSNDNLVNGDTWTLEGSAGGANGSLLANLQQAKLVNANPDGSGGSSLSETYSMLVENVGIRTSEARVAAEVAEATLKQSWSMREAVSGVNMDEEAGNLIRFQQAYMASTQVISTAQKLFDTLFASVGR